MSLQDIAVLLGIMLGLTQVVKTIVETADIIRSWHEDKEN